MLRVAVVLAAVLAAFAACYSKPDAPQLPNDAAKPADAAPDTTGGPRPCSPGIIDTFMTTSSSCPSEFVTTLGVSTSVDTNGGTLNFHVPPSPGESASCDGNMTYAFNTGFGVKLVVPPSVVLGEAWMSARVQNGSTVVRLVVQKTSTEYAVDLDCRGSVGAPVALQSAPTFLRLTSDRLPDETITGAVSSSLAGPYQMIGTCALNGPAGSSFVDLGASGGSGSSSIISFDDLTDCQ